MAHRLYRVGIRCPIGPTFLAHDWLISATRESESDVQLSKPFWQPIKYSRNVVNKKKNLPDARELLNRCCQSVVVCIVYCIVYSVSLYCILSCVLYHVLGHLNGVPTVPRWPIAEQSRSFHLITATVTGAGS